MSADTPAAEQVRSRLTLFQRTNPYEPPVLVLLAAFLCSLFLLLPNAADPDLWGHVRYGQDAIEEGTIHSTTTYSYLAEGHRWINHESVAEWVMGWVGTHAGGSGLMILKTLMASATLLLLHLVVRRRTLDSLASCILLLGGAWAMRYYWGTRPQMFSFLGYATLLFVLDQAFARWYAYKSSTEEEPDKRIHWTWLIPIPLVLMIWVNSHGGFVVGLAVTGFLLAGRGVQLLGTGGPTNRKAALGLSLIVVLSCLATLINPYGSQLLLWMLSSLGQPRPEILEWGPWDISSPAGQRLLWFVVPMTFALAISRKPKDLVELAVMGILLWQSIKHMRHSPFLVMSLMVWGAPHVRNTCRWLQSTLHHVLPKAELAPTATTTSEIPTHDWVRASRLTWWGAAGLCLWFATLIIQQCSAIRVEHERFPVDAFRFLKQQQIGGRTMVSFNWAQYAIDALCDPLGESHPSPPNTIAVDRMTNVARFNSGGNKPETLIAIDGRFRTAYPQKLIDWHFDFLIGDSRERVRDEASGPVDPTKMLSVGDPELVILERRNPVSCETMQKATSQWVLLYQDPIAEIWGRRDVYGDERNRRFVPPKQRVTIQQRPAVWSPWPAH